MVDGIILRSLGEVTIYNYLKSHDFSFKYGVDYPHQNGTLYKCDFYLFDYDVYIEYAGMENLRKTEKTKKILETYDSRIKIKKNYCINNNLNYYISNSVDDIINFTNNLYAQKN